MKKPLFTGQTVKLINIKFGMELPGTIVELVENQETKEIERIVILVNNQFLGYLSATKKGNNYYGEEIGKFIVSR